MILDSPAAMLKGPAPDYEMARRQLRRDVDELRLLAEATLRRSSRLAGLVEKYSEDMKAALARLDRDDGWHKWRVDESLRLTHLAQDRILKTQNPPNCKKAKKLVCHLNYACGFGCQAIRIKLILIKFHHALFYIFYICIFSGSSRGLLSCHSGCNEAHSCLFIQALEILKVIFSIFKFKQCLTQNSGETQGRSH